MPPCLVIQTVCRRVIYAKATISFPQAANSRRTMIALLTAIISQPILLQIVKSCYPGPDMGDKAMNCLVHILPRRFHACRT